MFRLVFLGVLTGGLMLIMWMSLSTALDLIGIWQKHQIDPHRMFEVGSWIAAIFGFAAPSLLHFAFSTIYRPRRRPPSQQPRTVLRRKRVEPNAAAPADAEKAKPDAVESGAEKP